jgi:thioredoxin reductase (NADPH)
MKPQKVHNLIIIGSGPAGLTASIYAARANLNPLLIEGKKPGGQLMTTTIVENWPGNTQIMGPELMKNMRDHAAAYGTQFIPGDIVSVDFTKKPFTLIDHKDNHYQSNAVIIATGATPKRLGCPGEDTYWGKGVTTCAVCDGAFYKDVPVVIIGGGDTAMEDASFMLNYTNDITIVHILDAFTASHAMQERVVNNPHIKKIFNSTVTEIKGDGNKVTGVLISNQKTGKAQEIPANGVFVAIGLRPNTKPFEGHIELLANGYIKVFSHTKTSVSGVFAAGDVQDYRYRQAITSAGAGCMAALDAERYLKKSL